MSEEFIDFAKKVADKGLVRCGGCLSKKSLNTNESFRATREDSWFESLSPSDIKAVSLEDAGDYELHRLAYQKRSDINTILHCQSQYATIISCYDEMPDLNVIPEIPRYVKDVGFTECHAVITKGLVEEVVRKLDDSDVIMLRNNGQFIVGDSYDDVMRKAIYLELACSIVVLGRSNISTIPFSIVSEINK